MQIPFFNPIARLVNKRIKSIVREAEAKFQERRDEIRTRAVVEEIEAAEQIVGEIVRLKT